MKGCLPWARRRVMTCPQTYARCGRPTQSGTRFYAAGGALLVLQNDAVSRDFKLPSGTAEGCGGRGGTVDEQGEKQGHQLNSRLYS